MGTVEDERDLRATYQRPHMYFFRKTPDALSRSRRDLAAVSAPSYPQFPYMNINEYCRLLQIET